MAAVTQNGEALSFVGAWQCDEDAACAKGRDSAEMDGLPMENPLQMEVLCDLTTVNGDLMVTYPLVNIQKAIENGNL